MPRGKGARNSKGNGERSQDGASQDSKENESKTELYRNRKQIWTFRGCKRFQQYLTDEVATRTRRRARQLQSVLLPSPACLIGLSAQMSLQNPASISFRVLKGGHYLQIKLCEAPHCSLLTLHCIPFLVLLTPFASKEVLLSFLCL